MAEKRMLSNLIINSDEFTDMPADAQMLYVRLNLAADDRGICDKPRQIMNVCRVPDDCMKILIAKKFVLIPNCRSNVVVIKHWWINNNCRSQRFKETRYIDVLDELFYDENKSYSKTAENHIPCSECGVPVSLPVVDQWIANGRPMVNQRLTIGRPMVDHWLPQNRIEESSIEESSKEQTNKEENNILSSSQVIGKGECERGNQAPSDPLMDSSTREALILGWRHKIDAFRRLNYDPTYIYRLAEAAGVSREEIDAVEEDAV